MIGGLGFLVIFAGGIMMLVSLDSIKYCDPTSNYTNLTTEERLCRSARCDNDGCYTYANICTNHICVDDKGEKIEALSKTDEGLLSIGTWVLAAGGGITAVGVLVVLTALLFEKYNPRTFLGFMRNRLESVQIAPETSNLELNTPRP